MARSPAQTAKPVGLRSSPRCRQTDDTPGCWRQFYPDSLTPYGHAAQFLRLRKLTEYVHISFLYSDTKHDDLISTHCLPTFRGSGLPSGIRGAIGDKE